MNVASVELSKELYELSGWKSGRHYWSMKNPKLCKGDNFMDGMSFAAYDLGYLLRKLPPSLEVVKIGKYDYVQYAAVAITNTYTVEDCNTPEDAAAKLAIELFKQGILTKEK